MSKVIRVLSGVVTKHIVPKETVKQRIERLRREQNAEIVKQLRDGTYESPKRNLSYKAIKRRLLKKQKKLKNKKPPKLNLNKKSYYKTSEWKAIRKEVLERDNYTCQECGSKSNLHVHHIKYLYHSKAPEDCITLCYKCHADKHPVNGLNILKSH
jgi:hypothetical protein